jgi:hypothetical protein
MESYPISNSSTLMKAALSQAGNRKPVFPCKRGGKEPLTPHGHLDATTDRSSITAWWNRYPGANIGIPTGQRSRILAVDHDTYKDGAASLEEVEAALGPISKGTAIKTGSGGRQYLFRYPEGLNIRNATGVLPGVDVRGEGGYILAPRSVTKGVYTRLDDRPLPEPPTQLIEALTEPQKTAGKARSITTATSISAEGPAILEGSRDDTLARIAGRLHDGTRSLEDLATQLREINTQRCEPPLPDQQVLKIARSINGREACKAGGGATPEFLAALEEVEHDLYRRDRDGEFKGMGGKSERDAIVGAIRIGRRVGGQILPGGGIRISASVREWAIETAVSKRAMLDYWKKGERKPGIVTRLKRRGIVRSDNADRKEGEAGAIVLVRRAGFHHSSTGGRSRGDGETFRAPRLRWSAPRFDRVGDEMVRSTIKRLGKGCGATIDALEAFGATMGKRRLADALGIKRVRDLQRRYLDPLEAAGVVECSGGTVALTSDYLDALDQEREVCGEQAAERRDRDKYQRERVAFRKRRQNPLSPHLANTGADGYIDELLPIEKCERSHFSPLAVAVRDYLDARPHDACQPLGWIGTTLWAYELFKGKPTPAEMKAAIEELGGARYLDGLLRRVA